MGCIGFVVFDMVVWYDIEFDYDFFFVEVFIDVGSIWIVFGGMVNGILIGNIIVNIFGLSGSFGFWV